MPEDVPAELELIDEGIADVPLDLEADPIGLTVITGTARRAYELADYLPLGMKGVILGKMQELEQYRTSGLLEQWVLAFNRCSGAIKAFERVARRRELPNPIAVVDGLMGASHISRHPFYPAPDTSWSN